MPSDVDSSKKWWKGPPSLLTTKVLTWTGGLGLAILAFASFLFDIEFDRLLLPCIALVCVALAGIADQHLSNRQAAVIGELELRRRGVDSPREIPVAASPNFSSIREEHSIEIRRDLLTTHGLVTDQPRGDHQASVSESEELKGSSNEPG